MGLVETLEKEFKDKYISRTKAIELIAKTENDNIYNAIRLILYFGIADSLEMFTLNFDKFEAHGEDFYNNDFLLRNNFFNEYIRLNRMIGECCQEDNFYKADELEMEQHNLFELDNIYWLKDDFFSNQDVRKILKLDEPNQTETPHIEPSQDNTAINELQNEINRLKTELQQAHDEIARLKEEYNNGLNVLFDKQGEYYAPDLAHTVNLWLYIYADGKIRNDSHTNLANNWIKENTRYNTADLNSQTIKRIREISTPFIDWNSKREKEQ